MVKLQIFLAVLLLSVAASHQLPSPQGVAENIKDNVVSLIDKTTDDVKNGVSKLNSLVENAVSAVHGVAANSSQVITNEYQNVLDKVSEIYQANSILSKECNAALESFRGAYAKMVKKSNNCVDRRVQVGISHLNKINNFADEAMRGLAAIRDEAIKCVSILHGTSNFFKALACVNNAAMRATWFVGKKIPPLTVEMTKLGGNILLLPPQIGYCFSSQFISSIYDNYQQTLSKVNECLVPSYFTTDAPRTTLMP